MIYMKFKLIDSEWFLKNFINWTSKNKFIDKFIQESQFNAKYTNQILEWIPYDRLKNVEYVDNKEGISTVKAIWLDGPIQSWSIENKWIRSDEKIVILKSLSNTSNEEFLTEV